MKLQTVDLEICKIFIFLKKGLGLFYQSHFVNDFSRKNFFMLFPINWPILIVWFPLLLEMSGIMFIENDFYLVCNVIDFEACLGFLIKPSSSFDFVNSVIPVSRTMNKWNSMLATLQLFPFNLASVKNQ